MKLPALIADAVIAILFYKMLLDSGTSRNRTYFAVAAWLLNPLTLVLGNVNDVDTIPLMLVVFSAFLVEKKRYGLATFSLIAAGLMRLLAFHRSSIPDRKNREGEGLGRNTVHDCANRCSLHTSPVLVGSLSARHDCVVSR